MFLICVRAVVARATSIWPATFTATIASRKPMMRTTAMISISVKPLRVFEVF